ncbi:major facilitator superfamily domain-containing protein [Flagelloscypha sp. PMI_526]|nr:major facilitator superfamily domain-containing protein [Flagelloscypha sp. PMI_526]
MASPRASFWSAHEHENMTSYFSDVDVEREVLIHEGGVDSGEDGDSRTPLDRTIDMIGMGSYQWALLTLCGLGWLADNMWVQTVAIILPRVQIHYSVPDSYAGLLSSSVFAGMMFGAVGWGSCSDLLGRSMAFNGTLFFTAVFGLAASFVNSFPMLCLLMFLLGSSVGGSMPTDGTLLLEHMPNGKQHLVTALSVFFSAGACISAIIALIVLPSRSCMKAESCNIDVDNGGWQLLLLILGVLTLGMFALRIVFFKLHESPRYLVHAGRAEEAVEALQLISKYNGETLTLDVEDVRDSHATKTTLSSPVRASTESPNRTTLFDADGDSPPATNYSSTRASDAPPLDGGSYSFNTPADETVPKIEDDPPRRTVGTRRPRRPSAASRRRSSVYEQKVFFALPHIIRKPLWAWWDRMLLVLAPEWRRTTIIVWVVWCLMSLAFTIFNVFLPKLLETRGVSEGEAEKTLEASLWDVVIFTLGGLPGPLLGAYMVDSPRVGKRWSLASTTFLTGFFCLVFSMVESEFAVRVSTVWISLSAATMWAVLYGWTPEIFETQIRGSACGIASALSRVGGMVAPVIGGMLIVISTAFPVYASALVYFICAVAGLLLQENEGAASGGPTLLH